MLQLCIRAEQVPVWVKHPLVLMQSMRATLAPAKDWSLQATPSLAVVCNDPTGKRDHLQRLSFAAHSLQIDPNALYLTSIQSSLASLGAGLSNSTAKPVASFLMIARL